VHAAVIRDGNAVGAERHVATDQPARDVPRTTSAKDRCIGSPLPPPPPVLVSTTVPAGNCRARILSGSSTVPSGKLSETSGPLPSPPPFSPQAGVFDRSNQIAP
jgi:hypothetical protein